MQAYRYTLSGSITCHYTDTDSDAPLTFTGGQVDRQTRPPTHVGVDTIPMVMPSHAWFGIGGEELGQRPGARLW